MNHGLELHYLSRPELAARPEEWWREVLGVVEFGATPEAPPGGIPALPLAMPPLYGRNCEIWRSAQPLQAGAHGRLRYRCNEEWLFCGLCVAESEFRAPQVENSAISLHHATGLAYTELFAALDTLGYPHLLRVWNYLPRIDAAASGGERYWEFNRARQDAFIAAGRPISGDVPAASALGALPDSPLVLYALAARRAGIALENPRQQSAYHYPAEYGPRSPTFSRACLAGQHAAGPLFISGTASVLGHASVHHDDPDAQTAEAFANIRALLLEANRIAGRERFTLPTLKYKVYVRHAADLPRVSARVRALLPAETPVLYLQAGICRRELLVEVEAVGERTD
jgi:enamine deaminase RidA (YjgF/YER057c/UK114 family)